MQRFRDRILPLNLVLSTLIFFVAAKIYVIPLIPQVSAATILLPILLLHSFRHLGLMFLTQGATKEGMPFQFAYPAAIGDLITAVLAFIAIPVVLMQLSFSIPLLWAFNIVGTLDLILAIVLGTMYNAQRYLGASYWIPAFWVPVLLVTHYVTFILLFTKWVS